MADACSNTDLPPAKPKQTRRRQRLSCVECTRRRQKCNRQVPCSSCLSRGIPQLCKWEPLVARPAPQKPPENAPLVSQQSTITTLTARVAALEELVLRQNNLLQACPWDTALSSQELISLDHPSQSSGEDRPSELREEGSPSGSSDNSESHVDYELQIAAVKMAQISLAPTHEYIGTGTILCALHKLGNPEDYRFPFAPSTNPTFINPPEPGLCQLRALIRKLLSQFPPRATVNELVDGYFIERNWQFGIPEPWFRRALNQMWTHIDTRCAGPGSCSSSAPCARCSHEINPHWISLVCSVFALAPRRLVGLKSRLYFSMGMEARRLVEDHMFLTPAYSAAPTEGMVHGVALSCMASALFAASLADRGRISDAWKITGTALRSAQAVGLHRDPGWQKWEKMDRQECELRLLGWWYLIISDRVYSLILGRPTMASHDTFDVKLVPGMLHGDGSANPYVHYQQACIGLMSLGEELLTKCLGIQAPSYATVLEMDRKLQHWLSKLHPSLDWRQPHNLTGSATPFQRNVAHQRHFCAAFYLSMVMNLHRIYLTETPPILPNPLKPVPRSATNPSRERCIEVAMQLVTTLCDAHEESAQWDARPSLPLLLFHYVYFVFDGAVTLVGALSQHSPHPKSRECLALIERATGMLQACAKANKTASEGEGDIALRGITILAALRKAGRWDERFGETTANPSLGSGTEASSFGAAAPSDAPPPYAELVDFGSPLSAASFPFLNAPLATTSSFPMPGPVHFEPASALPASAGDMQQDPFAPKACLAVPMMDFGGSGSVGGTTSKPSIQSMVMPYDLLLRSGTYNIDCWESVMGMGSAGCQADDGDD